MTLAPDFVFSQGSLQDYVDCPERFRLRYVEHIAWPVPMAAPALEAEEHLQRGADFHRLAHQHLLGIPDDLLAASIHDLDLKIWWENLLRYGPDIPGAKYPEASLSMPLGDYRLVAKLDLVVAQPPTKLTVVDWKTSRKRTERRWLAQRMQTRVYRYILTEAGARFMEGTPLAPAQIEMIYWFAEFPAQPERFPYDAEAYADDALTLEALAAEIDHAIEADVWPRTDDERRCRFCQYGSYCGRGEGTLSLDELEDEGVDEDFGADLDLEQVAEVEF